MIAYVDTPPTVEPHKDVFLLTAKSGEDTVQIAFTRHALHFLELQCKKAQAMRRAEEMGFEVKPFQKRKRKAK